MVERPLSNPTAAGDIFRDLEPQQRTRIEQSINSVVYPKGAIIYTPESQATNLFLLQSGWVQVYKISPEERVLHLFELEPVTLFGEMTHMGEWGTSARATSRCVIGLLDRAVMSDILQTYPQVALRFMELTGQRLRDMESKLVDIAFKNVPQRLATVLLQLAGVAGGQADTRLTPSITRYTHQQLAEMIGSYRETVTRTVGEFRDAGLIRVEEDVIYLTNLEKLQHLVYQVGNQNG